MQRWESRLHVFPIRRAALRGLNRDMTPGNPQCGDIRRYGSFYSSYQPEAKISPS